MADLHPELEKIVERCCIVGKCYFPPTVEEVRSAVREAADATLEHGAKIAERYIPDEYPAETIAEALRQEKEARRG